MNYYVDGSGWNGRQAGWVVTDESGTVIAEATYNVNRTNNEMEYEACLAACKEAGFKDTIYTDSQLVYNQIYGTWKLKKRELIPLCMDCRKKIEGKNLELIWVPREENVAGILLEKRK